MASDDELIALKNKIKALPLPEQLRLAASLIEADRLSIAESVVSSALDSLMALRLLKPKGVTNANRPK